MPPPVSVSQEDSGPLAALTQIGDSENESFAEPSVTMPEPAGATRKHNSVSSFFQRAKDALTIEPKVVPAADPVSLATPARDVGPDLYFASARVHEGQGNFAKADELYRKALEEAPGNLDIAVHYARMHDRAGNLDRAAELYRQTLQVHPREAAAYNDLGLCLARQKNHREAVSALEQAVQLQPTSTLYRNNLATILVDAGRPTDALTHLQAAHGPAIAHYNLAYLLYKRGEHEAAANYAQRALQLDPRMSQAASLLALLSGRRDAEFTVTNHHDAASIHRTPPVQPETASRRPTAPVVSNANAANRDDWGDAPRPTDVYSAAPPGRSVLLPPSRVPLSDAEADAPEAPTPEAGPYLLPPTQ